MAALHVFHDGESDWYIAESPEDAAAMQRADTGLTEEDQAWTFEQIPDDRPLSILVDDLGAVSDDGERLTLTCGEWVERNGKGALCSTEY